MAAEFSIDARWAVDVLEDDEVTRLIACWDASLVVSGATGM
jgi:hypothetical protein